MKKMLYFMLLNILFHECMWMKMYQTSFLNVWMQCNGVNVIRVDIWLNVKIFKWLSTQVLRISTNNNCFPSMATAILKHTFLNLMEFEVPSPI